MSATAVPHRLGSAAVSHDRSELVGLVARLAVYASARNRDVDREPRLITLTDDEALLLLDELKGEP